MSKHQTKRIDLSARLADYLLKEGLRQTSLRDLARAADTSDRMLLHYFETKDDLMAETMLRITERLMHKLQSGTAVELPPSELIAALARMMPSPDLQPYLSLGLELVAAAGGVDSPYRSAARRLFGIFYDWIRASVSVTEETQRDQEAAYVLSVIEGFVVLHNVGRRDLIDKALLEIAEA